MLEARLLIIPQAYVGCTLFKYTVSSHGRNDESQKPGSFCQMPDQKPEDVDCSDSRCTTTGTCKDLAIAVCNCPKWQGRTQVCNSCNAHGSLTSLQQSNTSQYPVHLCRLQLYRTRGPPVRELNGNECLTHIFGAFIARLWRLLLMVLIQLSAPISRSKATCPQTSCRPVESHMQSS
ncbi:hypothetical protein M011DRAFT_259548 [Sporormia fimetaria CBS 119925]|uniref:Uncharacterized protein n=1 Tax=Sporormia fimetaria CBS 119925 TaxID=1340428 RepID=A0A6A6UWQ6_9PLEO|nr:hypothetical protein M011DRAFT_259548 [Sporormia fimetaria CBS 119925]